MWWNKTKNQNELLDHIWQIRETNHSNLDQQQFFGKYD